MAERSRVDVNVNTAVTIPMVDLRPLHEECNGEITAAMAAVVAANDFINGAALRRFEHNVARYLNARHAIGVASGTDALVLALRAAGIGAGDEVITSAFSFWAGAEAIHHVGAKAVYVDIERNSMNLDPVAVDAAVTPSTRAILPVHIFGQATAMDKIMAIADRHKLQVIEDAAQAFGATYQHQKVGTWGTMGCFSFYPSKPLGCFGDGGLVVTNDDALADKLHLLHNHGAGENNRYAMYAYNSRLDSLQAAVLEIKLRHVDKHLKHRREVAARYTKLLAELPISCPAAQSDATHVYGQYTIRCPKRDDLRNYLRRCGIATAVHYPLPLYRQPASGDEYSGCHLPVTEETCQTCLSLPLYYGLTSNAQTKVADCIREFYATHNS